VGSGCTFTTPLPQNIGGNLTQLPLNVPGGANLAVTILSPLIQNPYNTQEHVGITHAFTPKLTISSDFTHILGLHETRRRNSIRLRARGTRPIRTNTCRGASDGMLMR